MNRLDPSKLAKSLLVIFAVVTLGYGLANADAFDVVVLQFMFLPWIVGPAALAAYFVKRYRTEPKAWLFLLAEAGAVASTVWLWVNLLMHPDAQNGIAMILFPVAQFGVVLAFALAVTVTGVVWRFASSSARR